MKFFPYILVALVAAIGGYSLSVLLDVRSTPVRADTLTQPQPAQPGLQIPIAPQTSRPLEPGQTFELPQAECSKLTGQGGLDSEDYFTCVLTNNSKWLVTDVRFHIATGNPEGSQSWERTYREAVRLEPGTSARISFKVIDSRDVETRWKILAARGFPL